MALIDDLRLVLNRLAPHGFRALFLEHGLDIQVNDLAAELARPLLTIDRSRPGFEDFAKEGLSGVTPGAPARSLLYHGLASPLVVRHLEDELTQFPTLADIETVEQYIFAAAQQSLQDFMQKYDDLAIVVFAREYRPAADTPHRAHADLCFSRTGISRVGTSPARYDRQARGFSPHVPGRPHAIAAVGCRFDAWLATSIPGRDTRDTLMRPQDGDQNRPFWIPVHKLFDGPECLVDVPISVRFEAAHINEKLARIHIHFDRLSRSGTAASSVDRTRLQSAPYTLRNETLAALSPAGEHVPGLLLPIDRPALVEPAQTEQGDFVTFIVPENPRLFETSLQIPAGRDAVGVSASQPRLGPEYVHARTEVRPDGTWMDLNQEADVATRMRQGAYRALHYVDYTADGWIEARIPALENRLASKAAYSIVAAPDFFPRADQRELEEFASQLFGNPDLAQQRVWRIPPAPLSDGRVPPNLQLPDAKFDTSDDTSTAIVASSVDGSRAPTVAVAPDLVRTPTLPDAAGNIYEPGWDISLAATEVDGTEVEHLANFGLGSPFPEDAKLCAALSAFWPGLSPDTTRTFAPRDSWPTVIPMTDEEIGQIGDASWDGLEGPRMIEQDGQRYMTYPSFAHADYTHHALQNRFRIDLIHQVARDEFRNRTFVMLLAYQAIGQLDRRPFQRRAAVISFRRLQADTEEVQEATAQAGSTLADPIYRIELANPEESRPVPGDPTRRWMPINDSVTFLFGRGPALVEQNGQWMRLR